MKKEAIFFEIPAVERTGEEVKEEEISFEVPETEEIYIEIETEEKKEDNMEKVGFYPTFFLDLKKQNMIILMYIGFQYIRRFYGSFKKRIKR